MRRKCAGRPKHCRWVEKIPEVTQFKPAGIPRKQLKQVKLSVDELEEGGEIVSIEESHGMGAGGYCICPKCNERILHQHAMPCQEQKCPKCRSRMMREGSYHHEKLIEKKLKKEKEK